MKISDQELDIHTEQNEEGQWIARVFHRPSGSIKISNLFDIEQEAIDDARQGLIALLEERKKGLGQR